MTASPSIQKLIAAYWEAEDVHLQAIRKTDAADDDTVDQAQADQRDAIDRANEAFIAVCSYLPVQRSEARLKAEFVQGRLREQMDSLPEDAVEALVASIAHLTQPATAVPA